MAFFWPFRRASFLCLCPNFLLAFSLFSALIFCVFSAKFSLTFSLFSTYFFLRLYSKILMNFRSIFYPMFMCLCSKVRTNFSVLYFISLCFLKFLLILVYFPRYFLSLFMFHFHSAFYLICLCLSSSIILFTNYLYISVFLTFKAFFLFSVLFSVCMFQNIFVSCLLSVILPCPRCITLITLIYSFCWSLSFILFPLFPSVSVFQ